MPRTRKGNNGENKGVPDTVPGPRGGRLRTGGTPGNKGGTGRPPDEFKRRMRELAAIADTAAENQKSYLERCIAGEFGPVFYFKALEFAADRGYGKPTQAVELSGADGGPLEVSVTRRIVKAGAGD